MKTKAQTALEFLMTYGWAFVIIIVLLVVMWQFGLFSPKNTEKGNAGFWGLVPTDFAYTSGGTLTVSFENQIGSVVNITKINATVGTEKHSDSMNEVVIAGGRKPWSYVFTSKNPAGSRFEAFISVDYIDDRTGETYRSSGKIWGGVENS
jgi:hypothetical protein